MGLKIRFVCATQSAQEDFFAKTALGRSLTLLARVVSLYIRLFPSNSTGLPVLSSNGHPVDFRDTRSAGAFGSPAWHAAYRRYLEKWGS